ncbi:MAG TPA: hypothetical protein VFZ00_28450 [Solirubrobacter sp.]|nr:hypothetical protein [Solirubrobacter sp.]
MSDDDRRRTDELAEQHACEHLADEPHRKEPTMTARETTRPLRWVNAVVEVVVPLDGVTVESTKFEKQEAAGRVAERIAELLPDDMGEFVLAGRWEDMSDD